MFRWQAGSRRTITPCYGLTSSPASGSTGLKVMMVRVHGQVRDMMRRSGLEESIGQAQIYLTVRAGLEDFMKRRRPEGGEPAP